MAVLGNFRAPLGNLLIFRTIFYHIVWAMSWQAGSSFACAGSRRTVAVLFAVLSSRLIGCENRNNNGAVFRLPRHAVRAMGGFARNSAGHMEWGKPGRAGRVRSRPTLLYLFVKWAIHGHPMTDAHMPEYRISVDQLRPGVFIRLEKTSWFDHPFLYNSFKIKDVEQMALLKSLGIREVICIPERSDVLPARKTAEAPAPERALPQETLDRLWQVKRERTRRLKEKKQRIAVCEERFTLCIRTFDAILRGISAGSQEAGREAIEFVDRLCQFFLDDVESTLHLMNVVDQGESAYSHPMNVAVLSLMVGKEAGLARDGMTALGLGALFHDIGKIGLPKKLLKKRGDLTRPEQELIARH